MTLDISVRPAIQSVPLAASRIAAEAVPQAAPTQLPESETVAPVGTAPQSRNDPEYGRERLARQIVYDRKAAEYIFQVVDQTNESVVHQYPDEARVRARTYFRELEQSQSEQRRLHTDRTA